MVYIVDDAECKNINDNKHEDTNLKTSEQKNKSNRKDHVGRVRRSALQLQKEIQCFELIALMRAKLKIKACTPMIYI